MKALLTAALLFATAPAFAEDVDVDVKVEKKVTGKIVIVGADGKRHEFTFGDDKKGAKGPVIKDGKIEIQLPDGKKHIIKVPELGKAQGGVPMIFGFRKMEADLDKDLQKQLEKAIKGAGGKLPKDVLEKLKKAMANKGGVYGFGPPMIMGPRMMPGGFRGPMIIGGPGFAPGGGAGMEKKLDLILKRLDSLEKKLNEMNKKK